MKTMLISPENLKENCAAVWSAITSMPGVGISIVDEKGRVLFANREFMRALRGPNSEDPTGRYLAELFPAEFADERMALIEQVTRTGTPVLLRQISMGLQFESAMHSIELSQGQRLVLTIMRPGLSEVDSDTFTIVESEIVDLGPLAVLSPRELEVLSMMSEGMLIQQIADKLFRSPKTIEKHRASISKKLGVTSRASLARMAHEARLEPADAKRKRLRLAS